MVSCDVLHVPALTLREGIALPSPAPRGLFPASQEATLYLGAHGDPEPSVRHVPCCRNKCMFIEEPCGRGLRVSRRSAPAVRMLPASAVVFQPFCVFQLFILSSYHFFHQERYCKHCFRYIHSRFEFGAQVAFLAGLHFPQVKNGVSTAQFVSLPGVDTAWREERGGCSVNPQA